MPRSVAGPGHADRLHASGSSSVVTPVAADRLNGTSVGLTTAEETAMSTNAEPITRPAPPADVDRMSDSASAILACGEYLATAPDMPSDQRAAVDVLRRENRVGTFHA